MITLSPRISPKSISRILPSTCVGLILLGGACGADSAEAPASADPFGWPPPAAVSRPWTRWWWLGSAVDTTNLTRQLTEFQQAGIGGVEICPIYGAKGYEDRFIDFLSPRWLEMFDHTTRETRRLGLGVDLTTGTGWPFGGPRVATNDASARVNLRRYEVAGGESLTSALPAGRLLCLQAVSDHGRRLDLTKKVEGSALNWKAPPGRWTLYAMALSGPVQKVKRAAPGGAGNVLDPFSVSAMDHYLDGFDEAFAPYRDDMPRAFFHDSYEYYLADGTPGFLREFEKRRGYDLRSQMPALFGEGPEETVIRVRSDYRETLADLHLEYVRRWTAWAHSRGSLTRNQAHGAPANLLDTYAAADIPEMELFGAAGEEAMPMMKLAASAAHVTGRSLVSAESFTWLNEHFQTSLSEVKQAADFLFLSGINHIVFHGIPYSPAEAPWPGWQFYASVNFGPQGGLWRHLPEFNDYVTRCQSILQSGQPANDVLLYVPFHDWWQGASSNLLVRLETSGRWMETAPFYQAAMTLWNRGYGFDEVSDRLLEGALCRQGKVELGGNSYQVVLLPGMRTLPEATLRKIISLAREGATVLVQGRLPDDVPGLERFEQRRKALRQMIGAIAPDSSDGAGMICIAVGKGMFIYGDDVARLLPAAGVAREACVDDGLRFVRRVHPRGYHYFFANRGDAPWDGWVTLATRARSAVILDPRFADRAGRAVLRSQPDGSLQCYLQLLPGESCILRTFTDDTVAGPAWPYRQAAGEPRLITGNWSVEFIEGGPELPKGYETTQLGSWTTREDPEAKRFAGTARYSIEFDRPAFPVDDWILDLGRICESARVRLNGRELGSWWCAPFQYPVGAFLQPVKNTLEIEVTSLDANRIRDLDQRRVNWKYFHDANVTSLGYRGPLDASTWPLRDSGLIGPVGLKPANRLTFPAP